MPVLTALAAVLLALLTTGSAAGPSPATAADTDGCPAGTPATTEARTERVTGAGGTEIAITVFRPGGVCAGDPTPVILQHHGWAGSRHTAAAAEPARGGGGDLDGLGALDGLTGGVDLGAFGFVDFVGLGAFLDAGYGVVSIDARGHGDSGGQAQIMRHDAEVRDYQAVLDFVHDELDWVTRGDGDGKDVVAGAFGASYGGAFALMTAAIDDRLDAIVPLITWHDLAATLAPNGVPRSAWLTALYVTGELQTDLDPRFRDWYLAASATGAVPDAAVEHFAGSSPATFLDSIDAPTLLVQGLPDTLFPLDEALATYAGLRERGVEVRLRGHNSGHVLPGVQPTRVDAYRREAVEVCTDDAAAEVLDFFAAHLDGDADARRRVEGRPRVAVPTEDGGCVSGPDWPLHDDERSAEVAAVVAPQPTGSTLVPLFTADEAVTVVGAPTLTGDVAADLSGDDRFFVSLAVAGPSGVRVVHDQVTPVRAAMADDEGRLRLGLTAVATELVPGDTLLLRVDGVNEQFVGTMSRTPGLALLTDVRVRVPVVDPAAD